MSVELGLTGLFSSVTSVSLVLDGFLFRGRVSLFSSATIAGPVLLVSDLFPTSSCRRFHLWRSSEQLSSASLMNSRATAMFFSRSLRRESSSLAISVLDRLLSNVLSFSCTFDILDQRAIAYDQSKPDVPHQRREQ